MLEKQIKLVRAELEELKKKPEEEERIKEKVLQLNDIEAKMKDAVGKLQSK